MIAPDSSVVIAALAPWHEAHDEARTALVGAKRWLIAHVAFETTAALSRMPERPLAPAVVLKALASMFPMQWMTLDGPEARQALQRAVATGVRGGALYDALIGATAARHKVQLVSADRRARRTYEALAVDVTYLSAAAAL